MTDAASRAADILARPVSLNGLTVPNRIAMAPMTRMFSPGGVPGEDVVGYYARRAAAGVGLIVTEGTYVGHDSAGQSDSVPRFHGEDQLMRLEERRRRRARGRAARSSRSSGTSAWSARPVSRPSPTRPPSVPPASPPRVPRSPARP